MFPARRRSSWVASAALRVPLAALAVGAAVCGPLVSWSTAEAGAQVTPAPGGVSSGLQLWLRSDLNGAGATPGVTTDNASVMQWKNIGGTAQLDGLWGAPIWNDDAANLSSFNPTIRFDRRLFGSRLVSRWGTRWISRSLLGMSLRRLLRVGTR